MGKYIVKYVRDKLGCPIGCIVGIDREILGCCFVNKADRPKSRKEMRELALERALMAANGKWKPWAGEGDFVKTNDYDWVVPNCMREDYNTMIERSKRYFKVED